MPCWEFVAHTQDCSGITKGLSFTFCQLSKGGGLKKMQQHMKEEFQERYGSNLSDNELHDTACAEIGGATCLRGCGQGCDDCDGGNVNKEPLALCSVPILAVH